MASIPSLTDYEALAATCLVDAGVLNHKIKVLETSKTSSVGNNVPHTPQEVKKLQLQLFESAQALLQAVTPPEYTLTQSLSASIMDLTAFRYISHWEVAKAVPTEGSVPYKDLAIKLGVDESQLKRVLRYAMTRQVFTETQTGGVAQTEASLLLVQGGISTLNRYSTNRGFPIASSFNEALEKWGHGSQEPNETAFNVFKGTDLAMFDYYEKNPAYATDFHQVMSFFTKTPPLSHDHIRRSFDWSSLAFSTVVDVGGSLGHCSMAILEANPTITCIVQDLPQIVAKATDPSTSIVPEHLSKRISFQSHSFWDPQPVTADVYFMRMIFHDWPAKYSKKILHALLKGMRPGARLLIMDYVTLPYGKLSLADERRMRIRDMQMMVMHNALERDEDEWRQLFAETDPRLRLVAIRTPPGSALSLIEVVLDAEVQTIAAEKAEVTESERIEPIVPEKTETLVSEKIDESLQPIVPQQAVQLAA